MDHKFSRSPGSKSVKMNLYTLFAILAVIIGISDGFHSDSALPNSNDDRVLGGETAVPGQFKYHVSILLRAKLSHHLCSGSLISNRWILSAARCTQPVRYLASELSVAVGAYLNKNDGQRYHLDRLINHPGFNNDNIHNDLCLLRTNKTIQFNDVVQPIPLSRRFVGEGEATTVTGWGPSRVREKLYYRYNENAHRFNENLKLWCRDRVSVGDCSLKFEN